MHEFDDISLLLQYVEHDSEEAFAALVTRHVNKVYSVALRHTRNPRQAEEITQAVFVILAQKSRQLGKRVILSGWLCQTARLTAMTFIRGEIRRAHREHEAHMQNLSNGTESDVWPQIAPLLDAAMAGLSKADYHAVVLRFFDGKSMKEVGAALGSSEDAAKMRINRAVEKLRLFFTKRGVMVSAAVLTVAISAKSVQAAPSMLAKTASTFAFAKGATASISTLTLIKGALKIMAWTKMKTAIVVGVGVLLAAGTATTLIIQHQARSKPQPVAASQTEFLRTSWQFVGYADPESAFESAFWAMSQGDVKTYLASLAPDGGLSREAQGKSDNEISAATRQIVGGLTGYKIIGTKIVSDDEVMLTFQPEMEANQAPVPQGRMMIRRVGNEWKISG